MRRENEKKHQENIEFILKVNEEFLAKSDAIFLQAPGLNKNILIGDSRPLVSFRKKIINIPFNVLKANYTNMMETYSKLTNVTLELHNEDVKKLLK